MEPEIQITDEIRRELSNLIDEFGGIRNTAALLGIGKTTLEKYVNGTLSAMRRNVWEKVLSSFIFQNRQTKMDSLAAILLSLRSELKESSANWQELFALKHEIEVLKQERNDMLDSDEINPFIMLDSLDLPNRYSIELVGGLVKAAEKAKTDSSSSKYELYGEMLLFAKIYEAFRPQRITQTDYYFRTVENLDRAYRELFSYLQIKPTIRFSKSYPCFADNYLDSPKKDHTATYWDDLLADLRLARGAVEKTMQEKATRLVLKFGTRLPYLVKSQAIEYLKRRCRYLNDENLQFDDEEGGRFIICGEKVNCKKIFELREYLAEKFRTPAGAEAAPVFDINED